MKTLLIVSTMLLVSGCSRSDNYRLFSSEAGKVYRLDKTSGQVSLIEGCKIVRLSEPPKGERENQVENVLERATQWPTLTLPVHPTIMVELKTMWREGKVFYILTALPYSGQIQKAMRTVLSSDRFVIQLSDSNGFHLLDIPVPIKVMERQVDSQDNIVNVEANDQVDCTSDIYLSLSSWSCSWTFEEK